MNFMEIAQTRQSCRSYDEARPVEEDKLTSILEAAQLSPSAATVSPTISPSAVVRPPRR